MIACGAEFARELRGSAVFLKRAEIDATNA